MPVPPHGVVETAPYRRHADRLLNDTEREGIADVITRNPEAGDIIAGTGGVRKVRIARPGGGKSGGYRVIHYFGGDDVPVFLLGVYARNEKANLTQAERNQMARLTAEIVEAYKAATRRRP
jgi:hypothetical protein